MQGVDDESEDEACNAEEGEEEEPRETDPIVAPPDVPPTQREQETSRKGNTEDFHSRVSWGDHSRIFNRYNSSGWYSAS